MPSFRPGGGGTTLFVSLEPNSDPNEAHKPPRVCTEGGGGTTGAPMPATWVPRPPPPATPEPCNAGGGGTAASPGPLTEPARPLCAIEGGGGTTAPPAARPAPGDPARKPSLVTCGGGATMRELPPPNPESPREAASNCGGGATTLAPGPRRARRPSTPAMPTGGATTEFFKLPKPLLPAAISGGGGATAEASPGACRPELVADRGTDGSSGVDARLGARSPTAAFKSGGTTRPGALRCSAATGIGGVDLAAARASARTGCLVFGGLLRAAGADFGGA